MRPLLRFIFFSLSFLLLVSQAQATHVRAGEITARRISTTSLTYEITFTGYFDLQNGRPAADAQVDVQFFVGSTGPIVVPRLLPIAEIGNNTSRNEYTFTYTFPAPGRFDISVNLDKRNNNVLNIGPPPTQELSFYIKSTLVINASLGQNRTPVLLNAPIDLAAVGQRYIHNPGAFDADGDSLAYRLVIPQQGIAGRPNGSNVQYADPNQVQPAGPTENGTFPPTFGIDALTGDLTWDAPSVPGFYNVAFVVEEWRNGIKIGEIVRDMQIIVVEARNDRPRLDSIPDLCVEAGSLIQQAIRATDKNGDRLILTTSGGVYRADLIDPQVAIFQPNQPPNPLGEAGGVFRWQTSCDHIRLEPYDVLFKVEDNAGPNFPNPNLFRKLVDIKSFRIQVYGPKPQNLTAEPIADAAGRAFRLTWDPYQCQIPGAQIVIYRKEGCSDFEANACQPGLPVSLGYQEVGRVAVGAISYVDNNDDQGLRRGVLYSYRLVVEFPRPGSNINEPGYLNGGGSSLPSSEFCLDLPLLIPVITNVTVDSTGTTNGQITIKWTRPIGLSPDALNGPSQYRLFRAVGLTGTDYTQIATINTQLVPGAADTLFVDRNLNTTQNAYRYRLEYYFTENNALVKLDDGEPASSVRLEQGNAESRQIRLQWTANVPWMNTNQRHKVYREDPANPGVFNQIAEVPVQGPETFSYIDDGTDRFAADGDISLQLSADSTYCYKVETVGTYGNNRIRPAILLNLSQIICVTPLDTIRPCPPVLSLDTLDCATLEPDAYCDQTTFTNNLSWIYPAQNAQNEECDPNIVQYNIYYARFADEQPALLTSVVPPPTPPSTTFAHTGLTSFAGCYVVTAVNRFGNESAPSNLVCKDNCPQFALPNVFTPNGDGRNDVFQPLNCPAFVESVEFRVFNRWGVKVFETTDLGINWNGKTNGGQDLAAGQYYYEAIVTFTSVNRPSEPLVLKGWIQLLR
ncbi:T9SS type B sorting domain-containing protein [Arundinibacter roseus]|uniref:Gliding motility-associated C-terminal domain-containing protein n=1 Tax=Arundinibacter roseus TaxID=2070510 RepID=A0A4R4KKZ8_9BACT|nr:gliding motility-associated C-terminal domain-containing protein [Arundinibacter roseus]TDB68888.1 gliding motility-associated C-terminal domain-containing protein [Arundinibacter roseus]